MGDNSYGQLGLGNNVNTNRPTQILASNVVAIANGRNHSLFVKTNGSLWGMGFNVGQLALGAGVPNGLQQTPALIDGSSVVTSIAAGETHSMYVKGGGLWVMGAAGSGQLGTGSFLHNTNYFPERIETVGVVATAAGDYHSLWVKNDGSLWGTGDNTSGQLGNGTSGANVYSPIQILNSNVFAVAAGNSHSLILKSDGSLWGMGNNGSNRLGQTNFSSTNLPVLIVASNVSAIAAGHDHSIFLKSDGSLWGMGDNSWGQLGVVPVGNIIHSNQPIRIVQSGVTGIAAGADCSFYIKSDGSLWGMGKGQNGELGMNYTGNPYPPTLIVAGKDYNKLSGEVLNGGGVHLTFEGILGSKYALERTFNLVPANWQPQVTNIAGVGGWLHFTNTPNTNTNNFWRIRAVP